MTDNIIPLQSPPEDEEPPYIATYDDLAEAIRDAYLSWPQLDPDPGKLAAHLRENCDFADGLFPGKRTTENTILTALQIAIGIVCGDRTEEQGEALEQASAVLDAVNEVVGIDLDDPDLKRLRAIDRDHLQLLADVRTSLAINQLIELRAALGLPVRGTLARLAKTSDDPGPEAAQ